MGKYERKPEEKGRVPYLLIPLWFFLLEAFGFRYLSPQEGPWPLAFGAVWAVLLAALLRLLKADFARAVLAVLGLGMLIYTGGQSGYFLLFQEMMWLSEFRYASEGADYLDVIFSYPAGWFLGLLGLGALLILILVRFPSWTLGSPKTLAAVLTAAMAAALCFLLPPLTFLGDSEIRYSGSDYGRAQSNEAVYENMFNPHRLYEICGLHQTLAKDLYTHFLYPLTPGYALAREAETEAVDQWFSQQPSPEENAMTGRLAGKNVILVLMESMDDWMIGEHTPTLERLMDEGVNFTRFYTPPYGGIRTFNTEFCINTGSFLSSAGGYAFDYVTNTFDQSLASLLEKEGYSAKTFHYNSPSFYSRGEFTPAMGYEEYVSYEDHVPAGKEGQQLLYDDCLLFDSEPLREDFFRQGPTLNFVITRSAHLSYRYNEVLGYWALKKYPEYRGLTGNEETDCALLKARLVDDFFARMLEELEAEGQLDNTVIIGVTDHYTYGYKNEPALLDLSGVTEKLLLEKTPCFIWSRDLPAMEVEKVLNTSDLLPTVLNLLGVESQYDYIGSDAFDPGYEGFVPFSDGSWITSDWAWSASGKKLISLSEASQPLSEEARKEMAGRVQSFIRINNLILETDYYGE